MRLVQLSRKLALKPSDIQGFLTNIYPGTEIGQNFRLSDEQVLQVVRHFDPSKESTILNEAATPEPAAPAEDVSIVQDSQQPEPAQESSVPAAEAVDPVSEETPFETAPEIIRAPKQELPGLRVVGKIELKEPKKKESAEPLAEGAEPRPERSERPVRPVRREQPQRAWRNPLDAQRQREIEEREERRRQQLEQEKARKTQKYLKKVKSAPTKPVRRQEETVVETQVEARPAPRTWLGKFTRWLTT